MFTVAVLLLLLGVTRAEPDTRPVVQDVGPLGQCFNLPKLDLLSKQLAPSGATIAKSFPGKCVKTWTGKSQSTRDTIHFMNIRQVYNFLNTNVKIDAELAGTFTFKTSLDAVTNSMTATNQSIEGTVLRVSDHSMSKTLSKDCLNEVDFKDEFLNDFKKLPNEIPHPEDSQSWKDYSHFIKTYGTHIVTGITYGASIYSYAFSRSGSAHTREDFKIKACLSFLGPEALKYLKGNINASVCAGTTSEDIEKASRFHMNDKVVVRGGTAETRAKLLHKRDPSLVEKFLEKGRETPTPVQYSFTSIWNLLSGKFYGTEYQAKVRNLEQFFKGFLAFGCKQMGIYDIVTTKFALAPYASKGNPMYQCLLLEPGCNKDSDCSYQAFEGCKCDGKTCFGNMLERRADGTIRKIAYNYKGYEWITQAPGCEYKYRSFKCKCLKKPGWSVIWMSNGLKDEPEDNEELSGSGEDDEDVDSH
ncbi:DELTA-alicitoxin-Pse2b [Nematostella vectensis]|uniref:DELTA-alicitoxin-Pse2b n=1 Tax=Nematostella vectensis TaxID=45351 RepID=UPI002076F60E|nr:DELTA-alicitoxin-Pse2b [Nematostella vectensis]